MRAGHQWLIPVILAPQEVEIGKIDSGSQLRQIVLKTLTRKVPNTKRAGELAQGVGPEFKTWYRNKKK
jgi:hypothetical protein